MEYYLAIDIGASSGRHILGWVENGRIRTREVYRFENKTVQKNGHLVWDVEMLFQHILQGMHRCAVEGAIPHTVGIDTFAVDFVLLDKNGQLLSDAIAYRDDRTLGMDAAVEEVLSFSELYQKTGIQKLPFNTIYQLMALKQQSPQLLQRAESLLMLPDYFHYRLTGKKKQEYTNATSTSLVNARTKSWDRDLIDALGYPQHLFMELSPPGTVLGCFTEEIAKEVGFSATVVLPATHDTASAYMAIPARDAHAVYISSGTWSLLGTELPTPMITTAGMQANFTNEGGYQYRFRFLKNITGLWMLQSLRRESAQALSFSDMETLAQESEYPYTVDANNSVFLAPANMRKAIMEVCLQNGVPAPATLGETIQCVYGSLAESYKAGLKELEEITGRTFQSIHVVGGGCKAGYLNRLTANRTGLPLYAGPDEGTTLGNLMAQMLAAGTFSSLQQARDAVRESFEITEYQPE